MQLGQKVADIGAGGGYFSLLFADAGGGYFSLLFADAGGREGQVFAVDTNPDTDQLARQIFRSVL
ncbi:MAG: hypothetical protein OEZ21_08485 [Candidatus Bathyarchaeota archaeon]|nr:hypothetical protein [Candidatus Bathyarchaeota archaeon]MDH5746974.1 hypothetical protein [Candidatus Bathyarchaeota archaeon]